MGQWIGSITGYFKRQEIGDKESVPRPRGCTFLVGRSPAATSNKTAINKDEVRRSVRRIPSIKLGTSKQPAKRRKERGQEDGKVDERSLAPVPRHSTRGGSWELASISQNPNPRDKEPPLHPPVHTLRHLPASSPLPGTSSLRFLVLVGFVKESPWAWSFAQGPR